MTGNIDPLRITTELAGISCNPPDGPADLISEYAKVTADFGHLRKVRCDEMRPCIEAHLGCEGSIPCVQGLPSASMYENEDWSRICGCPKNVQLLDFAISIAIALWKAETGTHIAAQERQARIRAVCDQLISLLIVSGIKFDLIIVEKDERPLLMWLRSQSTLRMCQGRSGDAACCRTEEEASRQYT